MTKNKKFYFRNPVLITCIYVSWMYLGLVWYSITSALSEFWNGNLSSPTLFFPLKTVLAILGPVHFCMYFRSLSISTKEPSGILMEIVLNLEINLEIIAILAILSWQTHDEKSIYLSLHQFIFTIHCSFQCTSFKLLSDLFLSILCLSMLL